MHIPRVPEIKIALISFHFAKHGAYLLFAIGIYQVWWPRAKWQVNICSVVNSSGTHSRAGLAATHICGAHRVQKKQNYCKVQSEYVPWTSASLTLTSQHCSLCHGQQAPVLGTTGMLKELFHWACSLLLPSHPSQLHFLLLILANSGCDIGPAKQWSLSGLKICVLMYTCVYTQVNT